MKKYRNKSNRIMKWRLKRKRKLKINKQKIREKVVIKMKIIHNYNNNSLSNRKFL